MNKQEQVYVAVREKILGGAYGPGYRLVIDRLAEEFGVSALPVREAIRRLEAEGLVIFRPNLGAQVTPADPTLFEESLKILAVLEGYATALAAPHMDAESIAAAEAATDRMEAAVGQLDVLSFSEANREFHRILTERCANPALIGLLDDIERRLDAIRRTVFTHIPYRGAGSIEDHREIIRLIRDGASAQRVEAAAREHKLRTVETFRAWQESHMGTPAGARS